mmetsp:Transcript_13410/g.42954  ORF Transcript_13410/g.42954 Transcript_13410/m.42954 type:complete len:285 (+) Transcript_13410:56-910(+)
MGGGVETCSRQRAGRPTCVNIAATGHRGAHAPRGNARARPWVLARTAIISGRSQARREDVPRKKRSASGERTAPRLRPQFVAAAMADATVALAMLAAATAATAAGLTPTATGLAGLAGLAGVGRATASPTAFCSSSRSVSSWSRMELAAPCSASICAPCASRALSSSSLRRFLPPSPSPSAASSPFSPPAFSPSAASAFEVDERCVSFVTHFIGVVTTDRPGSRSSRPVSVGETRMRKRCLSLWLEREVMRSLNMAVPCIATTSVLPTRSGSQVASCSTSCPFS